MQGYIKKGAKYVYSAHMASNKNPPRPPENPKVHFHSFQKASKNVLNMCILRIWPTRLPQTFEKKTKRNGTSQKTCETNANSKIIKKRAKYICVLTPWQIQGFQQN